MGSDISGEVTPPFTSFREMTDYAMGVYRELGPTKGMGIQTVILNLGHQTINDVRPDQYQAFYEGVEALKNNG